MKNIVITGAAKGIGYYLVQHLLDSGYQVTVLDINIDNLNDLAEKYPSLMAMVCDVRDKEHVNACVKKSVSIFGSVDCAVHNACLCTFDSLANTAEDTFRAVFDVNYFGALHLGQAVLPLMQRQKNGRVIFTSSGVGIMGFINISPYASSKVRLNRLQNVSTSNISRMESVFISFIPRSQEQNHLSPYLFQKN